MCGEQLLNIVHNYRHDENVSFHVVAQRSASVLMQHKARQRPLMFLGHSLGGLVIQQAS